jgi:hypothetical protein
LNTGIAFEIVPVWKNITPEISAELIDLWSRTQAIPDADEAAARASQAVCIVRDTDGVACGVGTAAVRVLPRLRQPMYYYRQFFVPEFRGQKQTIPFFNRARRVLQDYNVALAKPESLGVLVELESHLLATHYTRAYEPAAESTFIGYSPRGLHLRVSYFDDARLLSPVPARRRRQAGS